MHNSLKAIFTIIFALILFTLHAQPKDNSPYSRYGLGDLHDDHYFFMQGMGGLGASTMDSWHVNLVNPASYGHLQATAFEVGMDAGYKKLSTGIASANTFSGNVHYFSLGLPLINPIGDVLERVERNYDIGLVFALKPYSLVGYDVSSTEDHPDEGTIERNYVGDGGTYKFMTGLGGRYKDLAFGINAAYLFGEISYQSIVQFPDFPYAYYNDFREAFHVSGFLYNAGISYTFILNRKEMKKDETVQARKLIFGLYGNGKSSFNASANISRLGVNGGLNLEQDTFFIQDQITGKGTLPVRYGAGISYHHGRKLMAGVQYEAGLWSQFRNEVISNEYQMMDTYRISAGVDYVPNFFSYTNAFERMHYRLGFYYGTDGRSEEGEQFREAALNLGLGVPVVFKRKTSNIDLSLRIGRSLGDRIISESFVKFGLGLTFNDQEWFLKRRYY